MTTKPKKPKPNKVRAWIWGVLNPILDGLERQASLLDRGNLTWRHRTGELEYLFAPEDYLDRNGRDNLDDMYRFDRAQELRERFTRHRQLLENAARACKVAFESLRRWDPRTSTYQPQRRSSGLLGQTSGTRFMLILVGLGHSAQLSVYGSRFIGMSVKCSASTVCRSGNMRAALRPS